MRATCDAITDTVEDGRVYARAPVSEETAAYFDTADVTGFSTRSRYARLGAEVTCDEYEIDRSSGQIRAVMGVEQHVDAINIDYHLGDTLGRFYAYNKADIVTGDDLDALVTSHGIPGERTEDDTYAVDIEPGFLRPTPSGTVRASEVEQMDHTELMHHVPGCDAGLMERDDHFFQTVPIDMPEDHYALIQGTEWPGDYHLRSRLIDPEYSGTMVCEVLSEARHVDGRRPRPLLSFITADDAG